MAAILNQIEDGILKDICEVPLVLSNNNDAPGLEIAKKYNVKTKVIPSRNKSRSSFEAELIDLLDKIEFDYIVLAGFMRILTKKFVEKYRNKIINIHPADTKKYQGACGYKWAYDNNLDKTYITVHYVDEGVDTGTIIAQTEVDLSGLRSLEEIKEKGLSVEHKFYSEVLAKLIGANTENKSSSKLKEQ